MKIAVAAYSRISTDDPLQETSLEAQRAHFAEIIAAHDDWEMAGVYVEDGKSGTHAETRPELMRLISQCTEGNVQLVLTKSISRFSRNTVDCLSLIRSLKALGVGVVFEKENINTLTMGSEFFLSVLASFAAEESHSLSNNVKLGYRHRFQEGTFYYRRPPYGYVAKQGELEILQGEAEVVKDIFDRVLAGEKPSKIAEALETSGIPTKYSATWTGNTVTAIVSNITYTGDALLQKTWVDENFRTHRNQGERTQYYVPCHHEEIVSREVFILANRALGFVNPYDRLAVASEEDLKDKVEGSEEKRVTVIQPTRKQEVAGNEKLRVAAYCRVSTDSDEQESSYEVQCTHYHALITKNTNWTLAGIYADEGISGTSLKHRESFQRMIADAEAGKIDLILTKSISRFARNTLDCLTVVRNLKAKGIGITFEKEGIDTLDGTGEVILTILASIAQQESASISQNVRMGIQYRFQQGLPMVNCSRMLGFDKKNGKLVINEEQAHVVRRVYRDFLDGLSMDMIASDLRKEGVSSGTGCTTWPTSSVRYILTNEKYCGDLLLQKTLVEDFLTHRMVKNKGQLPQYYVAGAHSPVVPKRIFERVADEIFLRSQETQPGGTHYGSRHVLNSRTFCQCGERMKRLRRSVPVFRCDACEMEFPEPDLQVLVMRAFGRIASEEVEKAVQCLPLDASDRLERARAQRSEWRLRNLVRHQGMTVPGAACYDEEDFRARTQHEINGWRDSILSRLVEKVVPGCEVVFCGGISVSVGN